MRAYKRLGKEGFTLVELMIVVAIIGVLAALAIYGVRRYLASAKTSEAKNSIGAISRGAAGAYERESAAAQVLAEGGTSAAASHSLCGSSTSVPAAGVPAGTKYQPNTTEGQDFETGTAIAGWKCLKFGMSQPIYFQYQYTHFGDDGNAEGFEVSVAGDLDGDGSLRRYRRTGELNATTHELRTSTTLEVDELE